MEKKLCPECGAETTVENVNDIFGHRDVERCTGLIEISENQPLEACKWEQDLTP